MYCYPKWKIFLWNYEFNNKNFNLFVVFINYFVTGGTENDIHPCTNAPHKCCTHKQSLSSLYCLDEHGISFWTSFEQIRVPECFEVGTVYLASLVPSFSFH